MRDIFLRRHESRFYYWLRVVMYELTPYLIGTVFGALMAFVLFFNL